MRPSWSPRTTRTASAAAASALLFLSAMKKFQEPQLFQPWVPDILCRVDAESAAAMPDGAARAAAMPDGAAGTAAARSGGASLTAEGGRARSSSLAVLSREEWVAVAGLLEAGAALGMLIPVTRMFAATGAVGLVAASLAAVAWNQRLGDSGSRSGPAGRRVRR